MSKGIQGLSAVFPIAVASLLILGCTSGSGTQEEIATDSVSIANGRALFHRDCGSCHNFTHDGIGPQLGGIMGEVSADWLGGFIRNPQGAVEAKDERALALFASYRTLMPSFAHYKDEEVDDIIAYLNTRKEGRMKSPDRDPAALDNPVPEPIPMSDLVLELEQVAQIPPSAEPPLLTRIAKMDFRPDTKEMYVLDLRGKLYRLDNGRPELYMDMAELRPKFINTPGLATGFGSFAFHPDYQKNGLLYTTHTEGPDAAKADFSYADSIKVLLQWVLTEWKVEDKDNPTFSGKGRELLRVNMVHSFHGMQEITFNPLSKPGDDDYGLLYVGIGDGASVEFGYPFLVHSKTKIWGTIIRIDPSGRNSANGNYGIPRANPFANDREPDVLGEIYAYGFRNPHRITWTRDGRMLASNIGHHNIESLNLILPGHDYGWHIREGTFVMNAFGRLSEVFKLPPNDSTFHVTYPVAQYDHDEGSAISGGYEYWGSEVPGLNGKYIFGDIVSGRLFYVETKDLKLGSQAPIHEFQVMVGGQVKNLPQICGNNRVDLRFGRDAAGELYLFTKPDGKIYKIKKAGA